MPDDVGYGAMAQAAVDLTKYVLGTKTSSSTNGVTDSTQHAATTVTGDTSTDSSVKTHTDGTTIDTAETKTNSSTQNTADIGVITMLKQLASDAISNSTDSSKTSGLISGILQTAGDAMKSVFGNQQQAGVYNSAATTTINNDIMSRASAQAASAVLGYQVEQQKVADTALNQVGNLTSGTISASDTIQTNTRRSIADSDTESHTAVHNSATNIVDATSHVTNKSSTKSKTGLSVVCTFMHKKKLLSTRKYYTVSKDLLDKTAYVQKGYLVMAAPLVCILERDHTTSLSRAIMSIFAARTEEVCARKKVSGCSSSYYGKLARLGIATYVAPAAIYFWVIELASSFLKESEAI